MHYTAVIMEIMDQKLVEQEPVDISGAQNDAQAREIAKQAGLKWLADNGKRRAIVQISCNGRGLTVEVCAPEPPNGAKCQPM